MPRLSVAWAAALAVPFSSCSELRSATLEAPVYDAEVGPLLRSRCVSCHGDTAPAAGWSATSFLGTIACVSPAATPATLPSNARAPIVAALDGVPHVGLLTDAERSLVEAWVAGGAPAFRGTVHEIPIEAPRYRPGPGLLARTLH